LLKPSRNSSPRRKRIVLHETLVIFDESARNFDVENRTKSVPLYAAFCVEHRRGTSGGEIH